MNNQIIVSKTITLIEALKLMDSIERKLLVICDSDLFIGVISIGDIQRAILKNVEFSEPAIKHIRKDALYASTNDNVDNIKDLMKKERIECMPIVSPDGKLIDIIEWGEVFEQKYDFARPINCSVVLMAGGQGKRLKPLTNLVPKPLVPISNKTIIEEIMDRFVKAGCNNFYLSVNYKADLIKMYFKSINNPDYNIKYIQEDIPLGTGGSLGLLKGKIDSTFIVSNCDILVDLSLSDLVEYHKKSGNVATMVTVVKDFGIPYGIVETQQEGILIDIKEKPELVYQINSGIYVLEPEVLQYIEDRVFLNITDLLTKLSNDGKRVGVYPVSGKSWVDMGNWDDYLRLINK